MPIKSLTSGTYNPKSKLSDTTGTDTALSIGVYHMGRLHTFKRWNWQKVKHLPVSALYFYQQRHTSDIWEISCGEFLNSSV